ncbi:MAG: hypothetical protein V3R57_02745, partial [Candidatus Bathyarchaeia archaeon]
KVKVEAMVAEETINAIHDNSELSVISKHHQLFYNFIRRERDESALLHLIASKVLFNGVPETQNSFTRHRS